MEGRLMSLFLFALLAVGAKAESACDCHNLSLAPAPVCGGNHFTYINRCVAECQGVADAADGACGGAGLSLKASRDGGEAGAEQPLDFLDYSKAVEGASIDAAALSLFADQGYHFSARLQLAQRAPLYPKLLEQDMGEAGAGLKGATLTAANQTQRVALKATKSGDVYMKPIDAAVAETRFGAYLPASQSASGAAGQRRRALRQAEAGRKLLLIGKDDRKEVSLSQAANWPFPAIGFIKFKTPESGKSGYAGCSGALISERHVLTAGHCVYDTTARELYDLNTMQFFPGQAGTRAVPSVGVEDVWTVYNNAGPGSDCGDDDPGTHCSSKRDFFYDIAVLTLSEPIADVGFFGLGYDCTEKEYQVSTAGYPGDLPGWGTRMYQTSGTLEPFKGCAADSDLANNLVYSDLDSYQGQSGSAVWDGEYIIRALLNGGSDTSTLHRVISKWAFDLITEEVNS